MATSNQNVKQGFALGKINYILIAAGFLLMVIGYFLMSGGGASSSTEFSQDLFSSQRITIAPLFILAGFVLEIYAIMKKPK
jgi:hypothetical protein